MRGGRGVEEEWRGGEKKKKRRRDERRRRRRQGRGWRGIEGRGEEGGVKKWGMRGARHMRAGKKNTKRYGRRMLCG